MADGADSNPLVNTLCRDLDGDGCDDCSSGTDNPAADGIDTDGDGLCDAGDLDDDNDGVADVLDSAPLDNTQCRDDDGDSCDDCSSGTYNPAADGPDTDGDGQCDATDPDIDGDGALNADDTDDFNANVCSDNDNDGCDDCSGGSYNPAADGADFDGDGLCDSGDPDDDNDGALDADDSDDNNANVCSDTDGDGCDDCSSGSYDPAADGTDTDGDGLCDSGDPDLDGDGIDNVCDVDQTAGADCNGNGALDSCDIAVPTGADSGTSAPGTPISNALPPTIDTITLSGGLTLTDVDVDVNLTHSWVADVNMDLASPSGTSIRLHNGGGGQADDIDVTYDDSGIANGTPYNVGSVMQPSGPGALSDFNGQAGDGNWTMTIVDTAGGDDGTLIDWTVLVEGTLGGPGSTDCNGNGIPDECEADCDGNGVPNDCEITGGAADCNGNGLPDACELADGSATDCNGNGTLDSCDLVPQIGGETGTSAPGTPISNALPPTIDTITLSGGLTLTDVDVDVNLTHSWVSDVDMDLASPSGTLIRLHNGGGGSAADIDTTFDDNGIPNGSPYNAGSVMQPSGPGALSDFNGQAGDGNWTMTIVDTAAGDDGTLVDWSILATGLAAAVSSDCNLNSILDECEIADGSATDCDGNGTLDSCDIADGASDCNGNGLPDICDFSVTVEECSAPGAAISATLPPAVDVLVSAAGLTISDLDVGVDISHSWDGDILLTLESPAGTVVTLHDEAGGNTDNINVTYDDSGVPNAAPYDNAGASMQPTGPGTLADFNGEGTDGPWTMTATDSTGGDDGVLNSWCLIATGPGNDCNTNGIPDDCETDTDLDGLIDDCDPDDDGDGIDDVCDVDSTGGADCDLDGQDDSCQTDTDMDGSIDACDADDDGDGIDDVCDIDSTGGADCDLDGQDDSCQTDTDSDGTIDACDPDDDGDGIDDVCDIDSTGGADCDLDGQDDSCQTDTDSDGIIDACDPDDDGDGIDDVCDVDSTGGADCDGDGLDDSCETDTDGDGTPDDCEADDFIRGNANNDGNVDLGDGILILGYLFSGDAIPCLDAADCDDNGQVDITDAIYLFTYQFAGGAAPLAPFPACGTDPTDGDALDCLVTTCP